MAHHILEDELLRLLREQEGFSLYAQDFVTELEALRGRKLLDERTATGDDPL